MSIIRVVHNRENPYVMLYKETLWDTDLPLEALGFLTRCMSRPDNWTFRTEELAIACDLNIKTIWRLIKVLIKHGYALRINKRCKSDSRFEGCDYHFFERKMSEEEKQQYVEELKKCLPNSTFWSPALVSPASDKSGSQGPILIHTNKEEERKEREAPATPSPLPPPRSPFLQTRRKKEPEALEEVATRVALTKSQQAELLKKAKGDEALRAKWYQKLSDWKIAKNITGGSDYRCMTQWVIEAVAVGDSQASSIPQPPSSGSPPSPANNLEWLKQNKIAEWADSRLVLLEKGIRFTDGSSEEIYYSDNGFREQIINALRKRAYPWLQDLQK